MWLHIKYSQSVPKTYQIHLQYVPLSEAERKNFTPFPKSPENSIRNVNAVLSGMVFVSLRKAIQYSVNIAWSYIFSPYVTQRDFHLQGQISWIENSFFGNLQDRNSEIVSGQKRPGKGLCLDYNQIFQSDRLQSPNVLYTTQKAICNKMTGYWSSAPTQKSCMNSCFVCEQKVHPVPFTCWHKSYPIWCEWNVKQSWVIIVITLFCLSNILP